MLCVRSANHPLSVRAHLRDSAIFGKLLAFCCVFSSGPPPPFLRAEVGVLLIPTQIFIHERACAHKLSDRGQRTRERKRGVCVFAFATATHHDCGPFPIWESFHYELTHYITPRFHLSDRDQKNGVRAPYQLHILKI